jgi:murein DD-endopeptidase MepM/ murein hydrolase activator NlpD
MIAEVRVDMDQSLYPDMLQTTNRSKFLLIILLCVASTLLCIVLHTLYSSSSDEDYTNQELSLPTLSVPALEKESSTSAKPITLKPVVTPAPSTPKPQAKTITPLKTVKSAPKVIEKKVTNRKNEAWQYITTRPGDSMSSVFKRAGLTPQALQAIIHDNPKQARVISRIKPNQDIQILVQNKTLQTLIMPYSSTQSFVIERRNDKYTSQLKLREMNAQNQLATATVQGSLYATAKRMHIPFKLIEQMTAIFNWEIDFARDIRAGDQFTILYKAHYIENELVHTGDILAVTYTNKGRAYHAIRHESNGEVNYFSPEGTGLKKAFSRYPVQFTHISSMFSMSRMHPILHYKRAHQGVDLAAPLGTPVHATGDGRIEIIDRHSSYGNMIKIKHQNAYSSVYAHLHRFQKGLSQGDRVKRGQVIGYVGQTGLASGPHCHYEFHVNDLPINPSTVVLPRVASVPKHQMAAFKTTAKTLLAQLKLYETAHLATKKRTV